MATHRTEREIVVLPWPDAPDRCGPPLEYRVVSKGVGFDNNAHFGRWDAFVEYGIEAGMWEVRYWASSKPKRISEWVVFGEWADLRTAVEAALNIVRMDLGYI